MRETTIKHLTELADELLGFARRNPEAYDELCEAAAQVVEAKKKIAKTATRERENRYPRT